MKVGLGYNRLSGDRSPTVAVDGASITALTGAVGQQATFDISTIQDVETLHKTLGISVDAGGSYFGFSGSTKVDYANSCDFSSFSMYVVVKVSVHDATETIDAPVFSKDAVELLINNNPDRFRQRFGDTFIAGVKKGGEYFAIFQISSTSMTEKETVANQVHAAYNGGLTTAELNTSIKKSTESTTNHLETSIHVFRQGTITASDMNLEDIVRSAKDFPIGVSGDKAFPFAVVLQDYDGLRNPNDAFVYIDIQNRQDVLEDLAKKRFEFLALRDDLKYVLKHIEDFQNADRTAVVRDDVIKQLDQVVNAINTMQHEASVCTRDALQCKFTEFEAAKFSVPKLAKGTDDLLFSRGDAAIQKDPLAVALRESLPDIESKRGFNIAFAVGGGDSLPGPGKTRIRNSLPEAEQLGYDTALSYFLVRNSNLRFATIGAAIANANPVVAAARILGPDAFFTLGFDISTGLFGDPALGGQGDTVMGPGKQNILNSLNSSGAAGFNASMKLHLGPPPLPRQK
jgi:hypothetical protein